MRSSVKVVFGSAVLAASAFALSTSVPVQAQNQSSVVCLNVTQIMNTRATDERTIMYRMRDGKVWRNTLATPCPDIVRHSSGGYSQVTHSPWICANSQQIEVIETGMVCRLGEFTRVN